MDERRTIANFNQICCIENDPRVSCFASREEVAARLETNPIEGALVLVKGSHSIGLEKLIPLL